jgi:hypothetical protein
MYLSKKYQVKVQSILVKYAVFVLVLAVLVLVQSLLLIGCSFKNAAQNQYNLKLREQWFKNNNEIVISVCTSR